MRKQRLLEAKIFINAGKKMCSKCYFLQWKGFSYRKCTLFGLDLRYDGRGTHRAQTCLLSDRSYDD